MKKNSFHCVARSIGYYTLLAAFLLLFLPSIHAQTPVNLSPNVHPQFLDSSGNLLAGGFIYTYAAGTTTRQDTYTDSTGTTTNEWPIPLDATGAPSNGSTQTGIWLSNAGYKFCAYNSALVQQWCVDNIQPVPFLAGNNAWSGNQTFAGSSTFNGLASLTAGGSLTGIFSGNPVFSGNPSFSGNPTFTNGICPLGIVCVDGVTYAQTAAGTNSALTSAPVNGIVEVPDSANTLSDAVITIPKTKTLRFRGKGTFTVRQILFTDSTTDTTGTGSLECPEGATLQLANSVNLDVISEVDFATLTGTSNTFGVWRVTVKGCVIDGNKANQTSAGYGVRLFGRAFRIQDVTVQNCFSGGTWTEGNQAAFTNSTSDLEATMSNVHVIYNGGNGHTHKGPNDINIEHLVSNNNGGWGTQYAKSAHVSYENDYLNALGGSEVQSGGQISCSKSQFSAAAGVGLQLDNGSGATICSDSLYACVGCTAILVNTQNVNLAGAMQNSTTGLQMNNADANGNIFNLSVSNITGTQIAFTTGGGDSTYILNGNGSGNMTSGTIPTGAMLNLDVIGVTPQRYVQFQSRSINAGAWNPQLPTSNGEVLAAGNTDSAGILYTQNGSTCATASSVGANCTTTVTWPNSGFADTNYRVSCMGVGITSGVPVNGGVTSQTATTVVFQTVSASSVAAAQYTAIQCIAIHN